MSLDRLRRQQVARAAEQSRYAEDTPESFEKFSASELYCSNCKQSMPVVEKPLLYLADGQLFDYVCARCGESLGTRKG